MLEHLKENWRQLKDGEPGRRFRDVCDGLHRRETGGILAVRLVAATVGFVLILGGAFMIPAPGPGWVTVILGLALVATAWRPAARLLDWAEPKLRSAWERARNRWRSVSTAAKIAVGAVTVLVAAGLCYAAYAILRSWF